ncbi:hypothetical protein PHLGIDRAFT_449783 [Phlebiopsis gigantea 11061_1 CR5-6]|uniref:Uncharacterized protein n=1 Tax=Phlebiopsis gigantea (strain 11061_1 CR5-6) TaxID=745531 RepID=A0A0C3S795_PHLG1|nr:hypothetical protein PHLGIDRAFT_449783 [Phlebiopsis gigantea 11061_1 CR5-6]
MPRPRTDLGHWSRTIVVYKALLHRLLWVHCIISHFCSHHGCRRPPRIASPASLFFLHCARCPAASHRIAFLPFSLLVATYIHRCSSSLPCPRVLVPVSHPDVSFQVAKGFAFKPQNLAR